MSDFVNTIDLLGDEATAQAIIEKTITEFNDDAVNGIGENIFRNCSALASVNLPNVTSIKNYTFANCYVLASINIPKATSIDEHAFRSNRKLTSIDLPSVTSIIINAFYFCNTLSTIILRSESVCSLGGRSAFDGTPFGSGGTGGTVYVPSALISQYQNATNWSTLYAGGTCNFVAIEGSEYE